MRNETWDAIRDATDIVELIGERVKLKKRGRSYIGLCPFHAEKTPSFNVSREKGLYHCFGCRAAGNVFTFVMETQGLEKSEAARELARRAGITIEETDRSQRRDEIDEALSFAAGYFRERFTSDEGRRAAEYMRERGFTDETLERFNVGYAPPGKGLFKAGHAEGHTVQALQAAGLVHKNPSGEWADYFRDRVMFPVTGVTGKRVVGFGGRALGQGKPKYLNSPETARFRKRELLYGLSVARAAIRREGHFILVEGYTDVLALSQAGADNVVAPNGTAVTTEQCRLLYRYAQKGLLLFDGDDAGQTAARRTVPVLFGAGIAPSIARLPEGRDPADVALEGKESLEAALEKPLEPVDFLFSGTEEGTAQVAQRTSETLNAIALVLDDLLREVYVRRLSTLSGVRETVLFSRLEQLVASKGTHELKVRTDALSKEFREIVIVANAKGAGFLEGLKPEYLPQGDARKLLTRLFETGSLHELLSDDDSSLRSEIAMALEEGEGLNQTDIDAIERSLCMRHVRRHELDAIKTAESEEEIRRRAKTHHNLKREETEEGEKGTPESQGAEMKERVNVYSRRAESGSEEGW